MTRRGALIVIGCILAVLVGAFAFAYIKVVGIRSIAGNYENCSIATRSRFLEDGGSGPFLMLFLNSPKFGNSPGTDQSVVVTRLSFGEERKPAEAVNSDLSDGILPQYSEFLSGSVLAQVETANLDPEAVRFSSSTSLQNVETVQTASGPATITDIKVR